MKTKFALAGPRSGAATRRWREVSGDLFWAWGDQKEVVDEDKCVYGDADRMLY